MRRLFFLLRDGDATIEREFDDSEVSKWLTEAQEELVLNACFGTPSMEEGSERDAELYKLSKHAELNSNAFTVSNKYPYSWQADLPEDYLYNKHERANIQYSNVPRYNIPIRPINEDEYNELIISPHHRPYKRLLWRCSESSDTKRLILIGDKNTTISKYMFTYIKRPVPIVVDIMNPDNQVHCELDEIVHGDIVKRAVRMSVASTGSQKYGVILNEQNN